MKRLASAFALFLSTHALATDVAVNPKGSFLRACSADDGMLSPLVIVLDDYDITPGQTLRLEQLGDARVQVGGADTFSRGPIGAFSSSNSIAGTSTLNRISNAIDAGVDVVTPDGCEEGGGTPIATDVSYDFYIAGLNSEAMPLGTTYTDVVVPSGATHLFVCMFDSFYGDNGDPDGDFQLRIGTACRADWNNSGTVSVQDMFDFNASYFAGNADFNQGGGTSVQDLFDFLDAYFAGC